MCYNKIKTECGDYENRSIVTKITLLHSDWHM